MPLATKGACVCPGQSLRVPPAGAGGGLLNRPAVLTLGNDSFARANGSLPLLCWAGEAKAAGVRCRTAPSRCGGCPGKAGQERCRGSLSRRDGMARQGGDLSPLTGRAQIGQTLRSPSC